MTRKEILNEIEVKINKAKVHDKYSIFMYDCIKKVFYDNRNDSTKLEILYDTLNSWEDYNNIPYDIGFLLNSLEQDKKNTVAIHRTRFEYKNINNFPYDSKLVDIMTNGLINYGHNNAIGGSAFLNTIPNLSLTMTSLEGISGIINLVASYRSNNTTIIMVFPNNLVDSELGIKNNKENEIYDYKNKKYYVKPKYIIGALIKNNNNLDKFYSKDEILNKIYNSKYNVAI